VNSARLSGTHQCVSMVQNKNRWVFSEIPALIFYHSLLRLRYEAVGGHLEASCSKSLDFLAWKVTYSEKEQMF